MLLDVNLCRDISEQLHWNLSLAFSRYHRFFSQYTNLDFAWRTRFVIFRLFPSILLIAERKVRQRDRGTLRECQATNAIRFNLSFFIYDFEVRHLIYYYNRSIDKSKWHGAWVIWRNLCDSCINRCIRLPSSCFRNLHHKLHRWWIEMIGFALIWEYYCIIWFELLKQFSHSRDIWMARAMRTS